MAYDIPDEIKYKEKIVANLDAKQLLYVIAFGIAALLSYNLPFEGELKLLFPSLFAIAGVGFIFLNIEEKIKDIIAYYSNIRLAPHNSKSAQKFFEVKEIKDDVVYLDDGKVLIIFQIEPINFALLDENRKKTFMINYRSFLNQVTTPIQILIKTIPVELDNYFEKIEDNNKKRDIDVLDLYADFSKFEQEFILEKNIRERLFYLIMPFQPKMSLLKKAKNNETDLKELDDLTKILQEKLNSCNLENHRLNDDELETLFLSYSASSDETVEKTEKKNKTEPKKEDISEDLDRSMFTPSFGIRKDYARINDEFHRFVKVAGYPRKVEDGWLQTFLSKNEGYDISIHINPQTIQQTLVYLHNQIIQQASDLFMSTARGTPNPSLEIKKADTMRVYDSLYKGEEKMFGVSIYIDNNETNLNDLDRLTKKCASNLNALLMVPKITYWRVADAIKSTIPIAKDRLGTSRDFLTSSLSATFPFISPVNSKKDGILIGHEVETLNPIFIDFDGLINKHFFVIGVSGSGKSYTSKYLAMQHMLKEETKIYILDPNGEYSGLCKNLGGQTVELSRESDSVINIFDLGGDDFGGKLISLLSAFDILMGGLTETQKSILNRAFKTIYFKRGIIADDSETWDKQPPTFTDLLNVLKKKQKSLKGKSILTQDVSIESLIDRIEMYSKGNTFGFLDRMSNINIQKEIVCFDLSKLPSAVKTLLMFAVLEFINRKIKEDNKAKLVLIDEGWSLLRSKEAETYILEFVKTSRKFNTAIGFITQEIEDLLRSKTGKSILNTASVKILMRQNPSNIHLISKFLHLNEYAQNYLLSASKGQGLMITENNSYKFFITASKKLHALITTNPKEIVVRKKEEQKKKEAIKYKPKKGLYLESELKEEQQLACRKQGYSSIKTKLSRYGGGSWYLVKRRHNESKEHAFFCWSIYYELKKHFKNVKMSATTGADVTVKKGKEKICFEVETGSHLGRRNTEELKNKFDKVRQECSKLLIVVTDYNLRDKYKRFGEVITRNEIEDLALELKRACKLRED